MIDQPFNDNDKAPTDEEIKKALKKEFKCEICSFKSVLGKLMLREVSLIALGICPKCSQMQRH